MGLCDQFSRHCVDTPPPACHAPCPRRLAHVQPTGGEGGPAAHPRRPSALHLEAREGAQVAGELKAVHGYAEPLQAAQQGHPLAHAQPACRVEGMAHHVTLEPASRAAVRRRTGRVAQAAAVDVTNAVRSSRHAYRRHHWQAHGPAQPHRALGPCHPPANQDPSSAACPPSGQRRLQQLPTLLPLPAPRLCQTSPSAAPAAARHAGGPPGRAAGCRVRRAPSSQSLHSVGVMKGC